MKSIRSLLILSVFLTSSPTLGQLRIIDAYIGEDECTTDQGVVPALPPTPTPTPAAPPAPDVQTLETEELSFSSISPSQVILECPKGFQGKKSSFTSDGGSCVFLPTKSSSGAGTKLIFSCHKQTPDECGGTLQDCKAEATLECEPLTLKPSGKNAPECRLPGTYGQISSLSMALLALATMQRALVQVKLLSGGIPVPSEAPPPDPVLSPVQQSFGGKGKSKSPKTAP